MESTGAQHKYQTKKVTISKNNYGKLSSLIKIRLHHCELCIGNLEGCFYLYIIASMVHESNLFVLVSNFIWCNILLIKLGWHFEMVGAEVRLGIECDVLPFC